MSDLCKHRESSVFGRLLKSCRACEYESDPSLMDRAVTAFALIEDTRTGRFTPEDAARALKAMHGEHSA